MKLAGFLTGAGLAGLGVYAVTLLTEVTDDDRLSTLLRDHCLPYVTTGTTPFADIGRAPGVYDNVTLDSRLQNGGARLIYDNRFTAQWGETTGAVRPSRVCDIKPTYGEDTIAAFEVDTDQFLPRYTALFAEFETLVPDTDAVTSGPTVIGWYGADRSQNRGLRVVFIVSPGLVSSVLVGDDLAAD